MFRTHARIEHVNALQCNGLTSPPLPPSLLGQVIAALRALVEREDAASPRCELLIALTPPLSMGTSATGLLLRMTATKIRTSVT